MRIHHHFSIILCVAVVGAMALVAAVGALLGGVERAAHESGVASDQLVQVEMLVSECKRLVKATEGLTPRSSAESFALVDRALERSQVQLAKLRHGSLVVDTECVGRALSKLQRTRRLAADRSAGVQHPDELERFRDSTAAYARALDDVETAAVIAARGRQRTLTARRRTIMLIIGVICFAYLAVIERVRHWTTRHLIDPIQRMADVAGKAMSGRGAAQRLEHGNTEELSTLAGMLMSFAETIKANVRRRTAQVVRQKERLEQEVRVRRRTEQELRYAALRDTLTGLCNRDLLLDRAEQCLERLGRREGYDFAVLVIDLAREGGAAEPAQRLTADQVTVALAERLKEALDELGERYGVECWALARLSGIEFAVLLDGINTRSDANAVAESLRGELARPLRVQGHDVAFTTSIGIAFREDDVETAARMVGNAEAARYFAKAGGPGRCTVFKRGMHDQIADHEEKSGRLRRGLDNGEFYLLYQPIVCLRTGRLVGFETLARWEDPQRGTVSPVEFIPEAESCGLIIELGRWALEAACGQLQRWRGELADGQQVSVSVNVSRQQLVHPELVDVVRQVLRSTGIGSGNLKLEITESVVMEDPDTVTEALRRLKALGLEIHMDDFGTGYSSLSYLHRLPIDVLKIDRAFMSTLSADNSYADVVHTVVALARTLELQVTVEGVEAQEQLAQIRALDCDYGQGYYFAGPLSAEEASELIASDRRWVREAA